jgi:hypothetical protein
MVQRAFRMIQRIQKPAGDRKSRIKTILGSLSYLA